MTEENRKEEVVNDSEEKLQSEEVYTKVVRAGKRTYFFDVKATKKDDYYLTITESKKRLGKDGKFFYEKHKIFLYKEDFEKFEEGVKQTISFIEDIRNGNSHMDDQQKQDNTGAFTEVNFDDLGK